MQKVLLLRQHQVEKNHVISTFLYLLLVVRLYVGLGDKWVEVVVVVVMVVVVVGVVVLGRPIRQSDLLGSQTGYTTLRLYTVCLLFFCQSF